LRQGGGLNGGAKLVLGSTVLDDNANDRLSGNGGVDWFFANLGGGALDKITDRNKSSELVN
jgi:hypothetical protein